MEVEEEPTLDLGDIANPNILDDEVEDVPELIQEAAPKDAIDDIPKVKFTKRQTVKFNVKDLTDEEVLEREKLIWQVEQFYNHFPTELAETKKPRNLKTLPNDRLAQLVASLDKTIGSSTGGTFLKDVYIYFCKAIENISIRRGWFKLEGFSQSIEENEGIDKVIKRLEIKYLAGMAAYTSPEGTLVILTVLCALSVHRANTQKEKIKPHISKPVPEALATEAEDL